MDTPGLTYFCTLHVELDPIREMGEGRGGKRRIIPIIGGRAEGDISGKVLNLGADWQLVYDDGLAFLDTRYAIETEDGAVIEVINKGFRHGPPEVMQRVAKGEDVSPEDYYMRTHATLESGDPRYSWVNRMIFLGKGARRSASVEMALYIVT